MSDLYTPAVINSLRTLMGFKASSSAIFCREGWLFPEHTAAQPAASGGGAVPAHRDSVFLDFGRHLNEVDLMTWLYECCKLFSRNRAPC